MHNTIGLVHQRVVGLRKRVVAGTWFPKRVLYHLFSRNDLGFFFHFVAVRDSLQQRGLRPSNRTCLIVRKVCDGNAGDRSAQGVASDPDGITRILTVQALY